jgi:hypothetical protein
MARIPEVINGNRHAGNMAIEGRILEGHTSAYRAASIGTNTTLTIASAKFQKLTATAAFDLVLPAEEVSAGLEFHVTNSGSGAFDITVKDDSGATIETIPDNEQAVLTCNGTAWVSMGIVAATVATPDFSRTSTGTDEMINADLSINHASQVGVGVDATVAQVTTARTSGYAAAFRGKVTSLSGDTAGVDYYSFYALDPTVGEAAADHVAFKVGAGYDTALDLTACATGEAILRVADNLASALEVLQGANSYLKFVTTNDAERVTLGKVFAFPAPTVVAMADAACALVYGTAGAGEVKVTSNILLVDPASGGVSEDLTLPPVATSVGVVLFIANTGGERIVVKDVAAATIIEVDTAQHGVVWCDGTNWFGFMGAVT